jgi:hypothetical protein
MIRVVLLLMAILTTGEAVAQAPANKMNFPGRKAYIVNNCPFIELSGFSFENKYERSNFRLQTNLSWRNRGNVGITAFEVVVAKYDPFNRPLVGSRWFVPGHDSANYTPLMPGMQSSDGTSGLGSEHVYTGFAYVRAARLEDGTIWLFDQKKVEAEIQKLLPAIKDFSILNPPVAKSE